MIAKEYLLQYKRIDERVKVLQAEVDRLRADAESVQVNLDGMPSGFSNKDRISNLIALLVDHEKELIEELSNLWRMRIEIVNRLDELREPKYQRILYSRYIEGKTWETIAYEMGVSWRYCYMLHGHALNEFDRIIKKYK